MRNRPTFLHEIYDYQGKPYEMGYERGKKFSGLIKAALKNHVVGNLYAHDTWPTHKQYNKDWLAENRHDDYIEYEKWFETTPEWLREEIRGEAEGAGVPYENLLLSDKYFPFIIHTRPDERGVNQINGRVGNGCETFVAYDDATVGRKVISGGNAEGTSLTAGCCIKRIKPDEGNSLVMFGLEPWSGWGLFGMNEKGLSMSGNGVSCKTDYYGEVGFNLIFLRICLQECDTVEDVIDWFKGKKFIIGGHWCFSDTKKGVGVDFNGKHQLWDYESTFIPGASPIYTNPEAHIWEDVIRDETDPRFSWHTAWKRGYFRLERLYELYEEKKPLSIGDVPSILGDHGGRGSLIVRQEIDGAPPQGSDYTICVHGRKVSNGQGTMGYSGEYHTSKCSHIEDHDNKKMYVAWGSPCECGYVPYTPL